MCRGSSGSPRYSTLLPELADRLARAGLAVVSFEFSNPGMASQVYELDVVLDALRRGTVGIATETYGLIGHDTGAEVALLRTAADQRVRALVTLATGARLESNDDAVRVRWLDLPELSPVVERVVRVSIEWLAGHLP
jgi:pimeloyl-ACP methyl ester carboxylesterase